MLWIYNGGMKRPSISKNKKAGGDGLIFGLLFCGDARAYEIVWIGAGMSPLDGNSYNSYALPGAVLAAGQAGRRLPLLV
jgi:hypothetical protein